jgi:protein gp37
MGQTTCIAWTDHTANFWWGCQRVSPGCEHCYAEHLAVTRRKLPVWGPPSTTERKYIASAWRDVPKWNAAAIRDGVRRRLFVSSMADIFEDHPQVAQWRADALALLATCTGLDVQLLTKRPENIARMVPPSWLTTWPAHVWIGCTVEDQKRAAQRIPHLLAVPARVRFLSCEPLLESVDLRNGPLNRWSAPTARDASGSPVEWTDPCAGLIPVEWVIVGGESGFGARLFAIEWARSIVWQCRAARVPVFVKQMGDSPTERGILATSRFTAHHGADPSEWPAELRVQEFPR